MRTRAGRFLACRFPQKEKTFGLWAKHHDNQGNFPEVSHNNRITVVLRRSSNLRRQTISSCIAEPCYLIRRPKCFQVDFSGAILFYRDMRRLSVGLRPLCPAFLLLRTLHSPFIILSPSPIPHLILQTHSSLVFVFKSFNIPLYHLY